MYIHYYGQFQILTFQIFFLTKTFHMKPERIAKHNKTGNFYEILSEVKNCTNGENDGQVMVLYKKDELFFVRDKKEFFEKFTLV